MKSLVFFSLLILSLKNFAMEEKEVLKNSPILAGMMWEKLENLYRAGKIPRSGPILDINIVKKDYSLDKVMTSEFNDGNDFCSINFKLKSKDLPTIELNYIYTIERETFVSKHSEDKKFVTSVCSEFFNAPSKEVQVHDTAREPKRKIETSSAPQSATSKETGK